MPGSQDERMWCMVTHLAGLAGLVFPSFGQILGPLIPWLLKREQSPEVDAHGKEALNFQISVTIYGLVLAALAFISMLLTVVVIGVILLPLVGLASLGLFIAWLAFTIIGAVKANEGVLYRYPFTIRFLN
jgi:hypothetical protein